MPASKIIIGFESAGANIPTGWTELFYSTNTDLKSVRDAWVGTYVTPRARLLGQGARLTVVKVTQVSPTTRTSYIQKIGLAGQAQRYTGANDQFDPTQGDLWIRMQDANGKRRGCWLAGVPDSQTISALPNGITQSYVTDGTWTGWVKALKVLGACIQWKTPGSNPPVYNWTLIMDIEALEMRNRKRGRPFPLFRGRRLA